MISQVFKGPTPSFIKETPHVNSDSEPQIIDLEPSSIRKSSILTEPFPLRKRDQFIRMFSLQRDSSLVSILCIKKAHNTYNIYYFSVEVNFGKNKRTFCFIAFYLPSLLVTLAYIVSQIENDEFNEMPLFPIYLFLAFILNLPKLKSLHFKIKACLTHLFKIFFILFCIFAHYGTVKMIFPFLNELFSDSQFREFLVPGYQFLYFRIISLIFPMALQIYHRYLNTLNKDIVIENNRHKTVIAIRPIILFSLSVPLGNLLSL